MPEGFRTFTVTARQVTCFALIIYLFGIISLAILPTDTITPLEWFIVFLSLAAIVGLVARASTHISIPGEHWAYLATGFVGVITLLGYTLQAPEEPSQYKWRAGFLLLTGIIGSYGAHLAQHSEDDQEF